MLQAEISEAEAAVEVSVVIPTRNRPGLLLKAVASVLGQEFERFEAIVVMDGEDARTREALDVFNDARLSVIELAVSVGGAEARNAGVRAAAGRWVAFLDDDDEWLPHKLSRQIVAARKSKGKWPVVSSRLIASTPKYKAIRPMRSYDARRPVSEFLFCRGSLKDGPFALQTSTLMMPRELMLAFPLRGARHQDWDWVLRVERVFGVAFAMVDEPLVVYRTEDGRESAGNGQDWAFSMEWGREMRGYFSAKAYAWFLAAECASRAAKSRAGWRVYAYILRQFVRDGRPAAGSSVMMAFFLLFPHHLRKRFHRLARRWRQGDGGVSVMVPAGVQEAIGMEF